MICAEAPAGLESGPTRWKMVRMPRARRTGMTAFIAGWRAGAWKKAKRWLRRDGGAVGGRERDGDAEGFEDVGGAALRGDGAVAVFGNHDLSASRSCAGGCGCDEGSGGGDVEGAAGVGAGAAGVDEDAAFGFGEGDGCGGGAHGVDEAGDLGGGGAADGEGAEEGGELKLGGFAAKDGAEKRGGFVARQGLAVFDDSLEPGLKGH